MVTPPCFEFVFAPTQQLSTTDAKPITCGPSIHTASDRQHCLGSSLMTSPNRTACDHTFTHQPFLVNIVVVLAAMFKAQQMAVKADMTHGLLCRKGCCSKDCGWVVERRRLSTGPDEKLAEGLKRLSNTNTWTQWQWGPKQPIFHSAHTCRCRLVHHVNLILVSHVALWVLAAMF